MSIMLDHLIVPCQDRVSAARQLAMILGVPWAESAAIGPFSPVFVSDQLTLDFDQWSESVPTLHYAFQVDAAAFDGILSRLRACGIPYRSLPHGDQDQKVNEALGGRLVYWSEPAGHIWEALTVSYARQGFRQVPNGDA